MIEVTDDMVDAYNEASWNNPQASHGAEFPNVREGLAAVLAIVERDVLASAIEEAYGRGRDDEANDLGVVR